MHRSMLWLVIVMSIMLALTVGSLAQETYENLSEDRGLGLGM
jgi:hypothetical protein